MKRLWGADFGHPQVQTCALPGTGNEAIALRRNATGATVTDDNIMGPGYEQLVGIDHERPAPATTAPNHSGS